MRFDETGLDKFYRDTNTAFDLLELEVARRVHAFVQEVFISIAQASPQWSSNLVSNWNLSVGSPDLSYTEVPEKPGAADRRFRPYQLGSEPGIGRCVARMKTVMPGLWDATYYITNATPDDAGGYLVESLENNFSSLRPVNLVAGQVQLIEVAARRFQDRIL